MKLIIGLGNPGQQYEGTRHNLGFEVLESFRRKEGFSDWRLDKKFKAEIVKELDFTAKQQDSLILVRPQTYMNLSGLSVAKIAAFFKIPPGDIIVIHDDLDLPVGHLRIRQGGAAGGHHGVESIINDLGSDDFIRVRIGIGSWKTTSSEHGGNHTNVEHYVLEPFMQKEKSNIKSATKRAIQALETLLEKGIVSAQHQFNGA